MENNIAYLITGKHFEVEEVDFEQLKKYTNNVILDLKSFSILEMYDFKFRRALLELDRLGFNIGVYGEDNFIGATTLCRGLKIKLGMWFNKSEIEKINLSELNSLKLFMIGTKHTRFIGNNFEHVNTIVWDNIGDIEDSEIIKLDFIREPIQTLKLNTDLVKIYDENNLHPIPSDIISFNLKYLLIIK